MSFWEQAVRRGSVQFQVFHYVAQLLGIHSQAIGGSHERGLHLFARLDVFFGNHEILSAKNANNQGVALGLYEPLDFLVSFHDEFRALEPVGNIGRRIEDRLEDDAAGLPASQPARAGPNSTPADPIL